jgi:hypothetical protein
MVPEWVKEYASALSHWDDENERTGMIEWLCERVANEAAAQAIKDAIRPEALKFAKRQPIGG